MNFNFTTSSSTNTPSNLSETSKDQSNKPIFTFPSTAQTQSTPNTNPFSFTSSSSTAPSQTSFSFNTGPSSTANPVAGSAGGVSSNPSSSSSGTSSNPTQLFNFPPITPATSSETKTQTIAQFPSFGSSTTSSDGKNPSLFSFSNVTTPSQTASNINPPLSGTPSSQPFSFASQNITLNVKPTASSIAGSSTTSSGLGNQDQGKKEDKSVSFQPFVTNIPPSSENVPSNLSFATPLKTSSGLSNVITSSTLDSSQSSSSTTATPVSLKSPGPLTLSALKTEGPSKSITEPAKPTSSFTHIGAALAGTVAPSSQPSSQIPPSTIQNKTLEEIIHRWSKELDDHVKAFHKQAIEINEWDKALIEQGNKLTLLHDKTVQAEVMQRELEQNLEYLEAQQGELDGMLNFLQNDVERIYSHPPELQSSDLEREKMYSLGETIGSDMNRTFDDLNDLVDKLNLFMESSSSEDNQSLEIIKILNSHMNILEWADSTSRNLRDKIQSLSKIRSSLAMDKTRLYMQ